MVFLGHCMNCTALDGCYLLARNMPTQPLHFSCDCENKDINISIVKSKAYAECDIRKFTEYTFKDVQSSKGKNQIFYKLGFTIDDSNYLQTEYEKQALNQYLNENYILKNLDI